MLKWILSAVAITTLVLTSLWFSLEKHTQYLLLNPPPNLNVLFWSTPQRDAGFQAIDSLVVVDKNTISKGDNVTMLPLGNKLALNKKELEQAMSTLRIAGLVVIHNGKTRLESYGLGFSASGKWTSFSVAKSFTSTMVGAAIKDGYIKSLNDKVSDYITEMKGSAYDDVTIEQLITMTSGVQWNEDYNDPDSDVSKFNFHEPEDGLNATVSYMKALPRAYEPGEKWSYSTGETNLIGVLISQATGKSLAQYLSEKVWSTVGMEKDASWILGPSGNEIGGCCIQATTKDFARFGHFVLNEWHNDDSSIVPRGWFKSATSIKATTDTDAGYGYQWWISSDGSFQARGIFGQGILVDPNRNLVVAINGNWPKALDDEFTTGKQALYKMIQDSIDAENSLAARN